MGYDKQGFKKLIDWQLARDIRREIYTITKRFPKFEFRRASQMNDSARSVKQNIQEGYKQKSLRNYIRFLNISLCSLCELIGDIEDCDDDKLIDKEEFNKLEDMTTREDYLLKRHIKSLERKVKTKTPPNPSNPSNPS